MFATYRRDVPTITVVTLLFAVSGSVTRAQWLMSDSFDMGNTNGGAPGGWTLSAPAGTQISIVNSTVTAAASSPFFLAPIRCIPAGALRIWPGKTEKSRICGGSGTGASSLTSSSG